MRRLWKNVSLLFLLPVLLLTACTGREGVEGQNTGDGIPASMTENSTGNEKREDGSDILQGGMADGSNKDILAACDGMTITQTIESAAGRRISIDAQVDVDGISRVSCYRYIPVQFTEDSRKALLKQWFPAESWDVLKAAVYNEREKRWEFTTPIGASCIYRIVRFENPEEQILDVEVVSAGLDYTGGSILTATLSDTEFYEALTEEELLGMFTEEELLKLDEAYYLLNDVTGGHDASVIQHAGQAIIKKASGIDTYVCNYLHICKDSVGHRYAKAVFKQIVDGMPVTIYHDFTTVTTDDTPFTVKGWGGLFTVEEVGLNKQILTPEEAAAAMQKQIDAVQMQEMEICVTKIDLEYLTVISSDGTLEIVPVWRFWIGDDEMERLMLCEQILAVNAVNGELIWENRAPFGE